MNFKDILNYPLLRGERAERWASMLVEKPAIALGVISSLTACTLAFGVAGTLGLVMLAYSGWPRKINEMMEKRAERPGRKSDSQQQRMKLRSYSRSAGVLEEFIRQAEVKPARDIAVTYSLAFKNGPDAVKGVHHAEVNYSDNGASLVVDLGGFYKPGLPRRDVEAQAVFATAHEMGHIEIENLYGRNLLQRARETVAVPFMATSIIACTGIGLLLVPGTAALPLVKPLVDLLPHMLAYAFITGVGYAATTALKNIHSRQK